MKAGHDKRLTRRLITASLVQLSDDEHQWEGTLTDISGGGIHLIGRTDMIDSLHVGDSCHCVFTLPTGMISCTAEVAWIDEQWAAMGMSFKSLESRSRRTLETFCSSPF